MLELISWRVTLKELFFSIWTTWRTTRQNWCLWYRMKYTLLMLWKDWMSSFRIKWFVTILEQWDSSAIELLGCWKRWDIQMLEFSAVDFQNGLLKVDQWNLQFRTLKKKISNINLIMKKSHTSNKSKSMLTNYPKQLVLSNFWMLAPTLRQVWSLAPFSTPM